MGPSVGNPLTVNDADLLNLNLIGGIPGAGLIAAAAVNAGGDVLVPLNNPIHARVYWINAVDGVLSRVLEPISIRNPELYPLLFSNVGADWNPLRTAATFTAPLEGSGVRTELFLVCPTQNIIPGVFPELALIGPFGATTTTQLSSQSTIIAVNSTAPFAPAGTAFICQGPPVGGLPVAPCVDAFNYTGVNATNTAFTGVSGISGNKLSGLAVSPVPLTFEDTFPHLDPTPVPGTAATPLFLRIYDDEENFRRDVRIFCRCWGAHPVVAIDSIYSNADPTSGAPRGTYTEVVGEAACGGAGSSAPCSFTGYRAIRWGTGVVGNDIFGRLSNGNWESIQGLAPLNLGFDATVPER
jgi:hypothetical protein